MEIMSSLSKRTTPGLPNLLILTVSSPVNPKSPAAAGIFHICSWLLSLGPSRVDTKGKQLSPAVLLDTQSQKAALFGS